MAIVLSDIDENVESGDSYTPDLTGSDNGLIYIGTGIDTTSGGSMDGATQSSTSFTGDSAHNTQTAFGTRVFTFASGYILDASIPSGSNTFTQSTSGTPFDDTTYALLSLENLDQSTPVKEISTTLTYNNAAPGSITYDVDDGGLVVLIVTTNINTPQTPSGWTAQGANKALDIISDYRIYTRIATSDETGTTVTPTMDGNGNARGFSKLWVYTAATGGGPTTTPVSVSATHTATASMSKTVTYARTHSATHTSSASVSMFSEFFRTFTATHTGSSSVSTASEFFRTFNAVATHTSSMAKGIVVSVLSAATHTASASVSSLSVLGLTFTAGATHIASVVKKISKTFSTTHTGSADITKEVGKTLSATHTASANEEHASVLSVTSNATHTGSASSNQTFIAGTPTFSFIKGVIIQGVAMIGKLVKGSRV